MKIGMCMYLWTTNVGPEHEEILRTIKAIGFDGVEIPIFEGAPYEFEQTAKLLDRIGLDRTATSAIGNPEKNPISSDAMERRAGVDYVKWAVECAAAVGARSLCGPLHSTLGHFSGRSPSADELARSVEAQRQIGEHASNYGVCVALEAVNRFECYLVNTMDALCDHVRQIGHPNIRAMYDTFHANIEETDPNSALTKNADHIAHIHISENDRGVPGRGHIPWPEFYAALATTGYDNWLTIESFGRGLPDLAAATRVWRDFAESNEAVCHDGYTHISRSMEKAGLERG
ncbi:sugar phosphate isomerase/epimerase family protein [Hoeflea sp. TYP-13]|uniref:sugar phosphate isomerase/epimerase family protein n=1 Tax=Hoeflea sp. TYP-13 TaxID=3230023 RepID=UPI0034C66397